MRRRAWLVALMLPTFWSTPHTIARDDGPPPQAAVLPQYVARDSAGIRIIEYPTLGPMPPLNQGGAPNPLSLQLHQLPPAFRVADKPFLDLGGVRDHAAEELDPSHSLLGAAQLRNGNIVVNDRTQLKFFSATGKFLRAVGRHGRGPGEFIHTREMCVLNDDSILVIDLADQRLSLWTANGKHVRTFSPIGPVPFGACSAEGMVIVASGSQTSALSPGGDRLTAHRLTRPSGEIVRDLGLLPSAHFESGISREPSLIPVGDDLYVGNARTFEVRLQTLAGRPKRITRFTKPVASITDEEWHQRTQRMIPKRSSAANRRAIERMTARKPLGGFPAYSRVRVDPARRVWIQDFESEGGWTVLDAQGFLLGRLNLPGAGLNRRIQLAGVSTDHIVLLEEDEEGAVHLRFYRITLAMNRTRQRDWPRP